MTDERRGRVWVAWTIGGAFVVAAWFVTLVTPGEEQAQAAFPVVATVNEQASGRNLAVTVTDLRRASELSADEWSAEGNWLVVDLDAASVLTDDRARLGHVFVEIDGVRYSASDRPDSLLDASLTTGVPTSGSIAFELPDGLDAGTGALEFALRADTRLDSMIVLPFDLADIPAGDSAELLENGWTNP